jgi:mono/diheme cytochrome c family protein
MPKKMMTAAIACLVLGALLAGCGGGQPATQPATAGNAAAGEALFKQTTIGAAPGCSVCHSTEPDKAGVGPSLAGVASRAGQRVPGQTAVQYLRNSILNPNAYIVSSFSADGMYQDFSKVLTDEQVNDLVAYLLTLK